MTKDFFALIRTCKEPSETPFISSPNTITAHPQNPCLIFLPTPNFELFLVPLWTTFWPISAICSSRWDRYLGMTAAMTQVPVPVTKYGCCSFKLSFRCFELPLPLEQLEAIVPDICNDGVFNADTFKYQHQ